MIDRVVACMQSFEPNKRNFFFNLKKLEIYYITMAQPEENETGRTIIQRIGKRPDLVELLNPIDMLP